jgi:glycosyltransferase involved in cell wall biosynthesis
MARAEQLGVGARVRWAGRVSGAARFYRAFDAWVLSSRTEGTPIVLFEAMHAGTPIVATRVGGVPDVVDDTEALLVTSEQPAELARAIRSIHDDRASAATRAQRARLRLDRDHGSDQWLARYEQIYQAIANPLPVHV